MGADGESRGGDAGAAGRIQSLRADRIRAVEDGNGASGASTGGRGDRDVEGNHLSLIARVGA